MSTPPQNHDTAESTVRISMREIYDSVRDLVRSMDVVSRQIETLNLTVNNASQGTTTLETRVRMLETQKVVTPASMWTAIGVLGSLAGVLIALITVMANR